MMPTLPTSGVCALLTCDLSDAWQDTGANSIPGEGRECASLRYMQQRRMTEYFLCLRHTRYSASDRRERQDLQQDLHRQGTGLPAPTRRLCCPPCGVVLRQFFVCSEGVRQHVLEVVMAPLGLVGLCGIVEPRVDPFERPQSRRGHSHRSVAQTAGGLGQAM